MLPQEKLLKKCNLFKGWNLSTKEKACYHQDVVQSCDKHHKWSFHQEILHRYLHLFSAKSEISWQSYLQKRNMISQAIQSNDWASLMVLFSKQENIELEISVHENSEVAEDNKIKSHLIHTSKMNTSGYSNMKKWFDVTWRN